MPINADEVRSLEEQEEGDEEAKRWLAYATDQQHANLGPRGWTERLEKASREKERLDRDGESDEGGIFAPGLGVAALAKVPADHWARTKQAQVERMLIHRRLLDKRGLADGELPSAGVPGVNNWVPIGPSVVRKGQASGTPPVSGRVARIAIAPGGAPMYAASADGGVWRSDDYGASWKPTMDGFDIDPTALGSTSNCCGAIAIDLMDPKRVYVGTGEGDLDDFFANRFLGNLPAYRGVGAIRSDDGGAHWFQEKTDAMSPTLLGAAFFEIAVDPRDRENVVAATNVGLYHRVPDGTGGHQWTRVRPGKHTSVVACVVGMMTTFFAAEHSIGVFSSPDGAAWTAIGTGFPAGAGRIALAVRQQDPAVLYAFVAAANTFVGLSRLDGGAGAWADVSSLPALGAQASYNLAIAVDPNDANIVYLAGSFIANNGSIYRCAVANPTPNTYTMATTFIGTGVHADVHALVHVPGDSSALFAACDGGVFGTTSATVAATFTHRNTGLATLCCEAFAHHPTQLAVALVALQDNGTARYTGEEAWMHIANGDGGTPIINWADPNQVICKINKNTFLATDGGQSTVSLTAIGGGDADGQAPLFGAPIATTPYDPANPAAAGIVAFGFGRDTNHFGRDLYISSVFGAALGTPVATLPQRIFALCFASATRLYVATTGGQVYRFDLAMGVWAQSRLDNAAGGALPLAGLITDIEVDPVDATGASIFISFGGIGDPRHVWHFNGTAWTNRSGAGMTALLDSSHNAIVADPANPTNVYAAADIGVWQSADSGANWAPMQNGLPDAAVFDLQLHPTGRLLRASTHGRGMFEYRLDPPVQPDVELYARDTALDVGRASTVDGLADPERWPAEIVLHYLSRNIKVDVPTPTGYQTPSSNIDFLTFNDVIIDGSSHVATIDPATGTVVNRVYVEVHNRGVVVPTQVWVTLLLANASAGLPPLPAGYDADVRSRTPIVGSTWTTVGTAALSDVRGNFPRIAAFNVASTLLPPPASLPGQTHWCALAIVHSPDDVFASAETNADSLTIIDRKVAQRNFELVAFVGTPPAAEDGSWAALDVYGVPKDEGPKEIVIDSRAFNGRLGVLLPPDLRIDGVIGLLDRDEAFVKRWAKAHPERLRTLREKGRYSANACLQMIADIGHAAAGPFFLADRDERKTHVVSMALEPGKRYPLFLYFEPGPIEAGKRELVHVIRRDAKTHRVEGGCTYQIVIVKDPLK